MPIELLYEVTCDDCGAVEHPPANSKRDAIDWLRERGWGFETNRRIECFCRDCYEKKGKGK